MKPCAKCKIVKPLEEFHAAPEGRNGRKATCGECCNAAVRALRAANPEKHRADSAKRREANPERHRANVARWKKANPEKVKEYASRWQRANPEKFLASKAKRRAIKLSYTGPHHTAADVAALLVDQHGLCAYCGQPLDTYHVDHVVPLSRGGGNGADNIALACPACNMSKGRKLLLLEWVARS